MLNIVLHDRSIMYYVLSIVLLQNKSIVYIVLHNRSIVTLLQWTAEMKQVFWFQVSDSDR